LAAGLPTLLVEVAPLVEVARRSGRRRRSGADLVHEFDAAPGAGAIAAQVAWRRPGRRAADAARRARARRSSRSRPLVEVARAADLAAMLPTPLVASNAARSADGRHPAQDISRSPRTAPMYQANLLAAVRRQATPTGWMAGRTGRLPGKHVPRKESSLYREHVPARRHHATRGWRSGRVADSLGRGTSSATRSRA
jgi:hypothetical protein